MLTTKGSKGIQVEPATVVQGLIDDKNLERWQRCFCQVTKVFTCCVNHEGVPLTSFGGDSDEAERIKKLIDKDALRDMLFRVSESTLEDQAIEETAYPNLRQAVVSIKSGGKPIFSWLVFAVLSDVAETEDYEKAPLEDFSSTMTEKEFATIVDVLRAVSEELIHYKISVYDAQAESRRSRFSEKEMKMTLRRTETLTEVVQLLESDDAVEEIMQKLLKAVSEFLDISSAKICRIKTGGQTMDILADWNKEGIARNFEGTVNQQVPFFLHTKKALVLSGKASLNAEEREDMEERNIKSIIVLPIVINDKINMYACFCEEENERIWQVEEITFLNDAVKILQSILTKRIQKNSLASSYASLETILDNVGGAVYVQDLTTGSILFLNRSMRHTFERELKEGTIQDLIESEIRADNGMGEINLPGRERWYELYYTRMNWVDGSPVRLCALYDVTEKKIYQKKIEQQAYTDFLTGLYNRMCCERDLAKYVDEAQRYHKKGALLYLDLDDFKHINDGLGHQYGDVLLKSISHSLQRVEGIRSTCYRMGGDEFVIIIPPGDYEKFEGIIEGIKDIFMKPWYLKDADYYCTMSMGIVEFPESGCMVHDLIKKADIAMYEAKKHGKNRVARYSDSIESKSGKRLDMEKNMRDAATDGYQEFEVYFQPIIDIQKEGQPCTGAEALIRWNSTELGFIPPSEFIPLAEYLGLINPIGNYVLREACKYCKYWNDNGYPNYRVNVNLSVIQLLQTDIVEIVEQTVKESGINPRNLTLEVTESLAINDMERMKEILGSIKQLGVRIALDDFGTGYSSLNHIREIPFDVIKVDQTFIRDLEKDAYAKSFIKMVADLAEAIGVNLCVEGVETKVQYEILSGMRVGLLQGFYFDRPMQRSAFEKKYAPNLYSTAENTEKATTEKGLE